MDYKKFEQGRKKVKKRREKHKGSIEIPYPTGYSETDLQSIILSELKKEKLNARAEVFSKDLTCRFDIVVFKERLPQWIIEVKKDNQGITAEQKNKYERFGLPVTYIFGEADAFSFFSSGIQDIKDAELITTNNPKPTRRDKLTQEGQECRKCSTPVLKKDGGKYLKPGQKYYFKHYLICPKCNTYYMLESEKVYL